MTKLESRQQEEIKTLRRAIKEGRIFGATVVIGYNISPSLSKQWRKFNSLCAKADDLFGGEKSKKNKR